MVYWDNSGTPDDAFVTRPGDVAVKGMSFKDPVLVDIVTGRVYEIPGKRISKTGDFVIFKDMPVYDAPMLIAEKSVLPIEK